MSSDPASSPTTEEVTRLPARQALSARVTRALVGAFRERNAALTNAGAHPGSEALDAAVAATPFGDVEAILQRGPEQPAEARLLALLYALGLREPVDDAAPAAVWLAAHSRCDALRYVDPALGDEASTVWRAIADVAIDPGRFGLARPEAVVAAGAVAISSATDQAERVATDTDDEIVRNVALIGHTRAKNGPNGALVGEVSPAPRGAVATTLLALSGFLFATGACRLIGKAALGYKRPARLRLTTRGVELGYRTELMGKVLRDRETVIPLSGLARVTREVRYSRLGLYAGLAALVLGSYVGVGLLVDGARVPGTSPPLLGLGVLVILLGLVIDFGLTALADGARGKVRVVVEPRKGRRLCVGGLERRRADAMLADVSARASAERA